MAAPTGLGWNQIEVFHQDLEALRRMARLEPTNPARKEEDSMLGERSYPLERLLRRLYLAALGGFD